MEADTLDISWLPFDLKREIRKYPTHHSFHNVYLDGRYFLKAFLRPDWQEVHETNLLREFPDAQVILD